MTVLDTIYEYILLIPMNCCLSMPSRVLYGLILVDKT